MDRPASDVAAFLRAANMVLRRSTVTRNRSARSQPRMQLLMPAFATTEDILIEHNIECRSTAPGSFYTTCPRCSPGRKKVDGHCLGVTIYDDGGVGWRCFHCEWSGGASLKSSRRPISSSRARPRVRPDNCAIALAIWAEAGDPRGTPAERYLIAERDLHLSDEIAGSVIRFHPALWYERAHVPGLVALFRDIETDEPCGIHRVFLNDAGRKIERRMLGRARGAAIKLDADENVTLGLVIGEGVETCIAAQLAGLRPVWALGSANAIGQFPVLPGIETITVLGENNDGGKNAEQMQLCAARWFGAGKEALGFTPKLVAGDDLNSVFMRLRK
jgi:hypothetical protein